MLSGNSIAKTTWTKTLLEAQRIQDIEFIIKIKTNLKRPSFYCLIHFYKRRSFSPELDLTMEADVYDTQCHLASEIYHLMNTMGVSL